MTTGEHIPVKLITDNVDDYAEFDSRLEDLDNGFQRLAKLVKSCCIEVDVLRDKLSTLRKDLYKHIVKE